MTNVLYACCNLLSFRTIDICALAPVESVTIDSIELYFDTIEEQPYIRVYGICSVTTLTLFYVQK